MTLTASIRRSNWSRGGSRTIGLVVSCIAASMVPSSTLPIVGADNEIVVNTRIAGLPIALEGAPPGVGVIGGVAPGGVENVWVRQASGAIVDLGEGHRPNFWLGLPNDPMLVGTVSERFGSDLNGDGDVNDQVLATSRNGIPFLPLPGEVISGGLAALYCLVRVSSQLAVACSTETSSSTDLNNDGDTVDVEMVLLRSTGAIERPGYFIDETVGQPLSRRVTVLRDGSVSIGPWRVFPNGTVTNTDAEFPNGEVTALVGTSRLVRLPTMTSQTYMLVPATGPPIVLHPSAAPIQVGAELWVQTDSDGLCRLTATGTQSCLGLTTRLDPLGFIVLGDGAAVFIGFPLGSLGARHAYHVVAGAPPTDMGTDAIDVGLTDLGDGGGALVSLGYAMRMIHVSTTGAAELPIGRTTPVARSLGDGRALINVDEQLGGVDLNKDGDLQDDVTHLFDGGKLINLGVIAVLDSTFPAFGPYSRALAVPDDSGIIVVTREIYTGDQNGDGDTGDLIASLWDGVTVRSLGRAVAPGVGIGGLPGLFASLGANTALFGVSEASEKEDLNGDGVLQDFVVFSVSYTMGSPPPPPPPPRPPYTPLSPSRVLDTRPGGPQVGYSGPKLTAGQTIEVTAPVGAAAVVMNVTGLNVDQEGFVTVYPCGEPRPTVSNLNLTPTLITPNLTITKVGANGKVCIFTQRSADLIADLAGTYPT